MRLRPVESPVTASQGVLTTYSNLARRTDRDLHKQVMSPWKGTAKIWKPQTHSKKDMPKKKKSWLSKIYFVVLFGPF